MIHPKKFIVAQSELDKREYRLITLSNGLRCLLIAEEDLGAAAGELDRSTSSSSTPRKQYNHRPRENLKPASGMDDVELMDYDSALDSDYVPTDSSSAGGSSASECSDSASEMSVDDSSQGSDSESDGEGDSDEGDSSAPARKAAAAMAVNVGHWSDPDDISGLAHFCEHMLFFSNAKYPQENGWETYLSAHGGSSNASTDAEQTIYQFDVHPTYLDDALDRFAQFFISPLFSSDAIDREILAVDSEFNISLQNDSHRLHEVQNCTAASRHPFAKFGWGNTKSLVTDVKAKGFVFLPWSFNLFE
jgi:nardilysin